MGNRLVHRRPLGNAGQQGGLGQGNILDLLAEVEPRRLVDAVTGVAEVNLVEIEKENFVLGETVFDFFGKQHLTNFARERPLSREEEGSRHLLRYGGGALTETAAAQVEQHRPRDAHVVDALVISEIRVLGGNNRIQHVLRNARDGNHRAALLEQLSDHLAVSRDDSRSLRRIVPFEQRPDGRKRKGIVIENRRNTEHASDDEKDTDEQQSLDNSQNAAALCGASFKFRSGATGSRWPHAFRIPL